MKKRRTETTKYELISLATNRLLQDSLEDEYDILAKTWANELRKMDPKHQLLAKKVISDVLFEVRCGNLSRTSVQITCDNEFHFTAPTRSCTPYSTQSCDSSGLTAYYRTSPVFQTITQGIGSSSFHQTTNELSEYFSSFQPHTN